MFSVAEGAAPPGGRLEPEDFNHVPGGQPLGDPKAVPLMKVCNYQFLDDLSFIRRPEDVFDSPKPGLEIGVCWCLNRTGFHLRI